MNEYDVQKSIKAQKEYCEAKKYPHFAPHNGVCFKCRKNIYELIKHDNRGGIGAQKYTTGISVERASKELVTGCPHCSRSYCD